MFRLVKKCYKMNISNGTRIFIARLCQSINIGVTAVTAPICWLWIYTKS